MTKQYQRREHADTVRAEAAARAIIEERLRIDRELHDSDADSIGVIEVQGDHVERVMAWLTQAGHRVRRAGG